MKEIFAAPRWEYAFNMRGGWVTGTVAPTINRNGNTVTVVARVNVPEGSGGGDALFNGVDLHVGAALLFDGRSEGELQFSGLSAPNAFQQSFSLICGDGIQVQSGKNKEIFAALPPSSGTESQQMIVSAFSKGDWKIDKKYPEDFIGNTYTQSSGPITFQVYDTETRQTNTYTMAFEITLVKGEAAPLSSVDPLAFQEQQTGIPLDTLVPAGEPESSEPQSSPEPAVEQETVVPQVTPIPDGETEDGDPQSTSAPAGEQGSDGTEELPAAAGEMTPAPASAVQENEMNETSSTPVLLYDAAEPEASISKVLYKTDSGSKGTAFHAPYFSCSYTDRSGKNAQKDDAPVCYWKKDVLVAYAGIHVPKAGVPGSPLLLNMGFDLGAAIRFENATDAVLEISRTSASAGLKQSFAKSEHDMADSAAMLLAPGESGVVSAYLAESRQLDAQELDLESLPGMACTREMRLDFKVTNKSTGESRKYAILLVFSAKTEAPAATMEPPVETLPLPAEEISLTPAPSPTQTPAPEQTPAPSLTPEPTVLSALTMTPVTSLLPEPVVTPMSAQTPTSMPEQTAANTPTTTPLPSSEPAAVPAPILLPAVGPAAAPAPEPAAAPAPTLSPAAEPAVASVP